MGEGRGASGTVWRNHGVCAEVPNHALPPVQTPDRGLSCFLPPSLPCHCKRQSASCPRRCLRGLLIVRFYGTNGRINVWIILDRCGRADVVPAASAPHEAGATQSFTNNFVG